MASALRFLVLLHLNLMASFVDVAAFVTSVVKPSSIQSIPAAKNRQYKKWRLNAQADYDDSQRLLSLLSNDVRSEDQISNSISTLESKYRSTNNTHADEDQSRFDNLIDLYEVKYVLSSNKKDNPVGGKWTRSNGLAQKLFRTRKTFQHLLPFNTTGLSLPIYAKGAVAEAINVISLDALDGLIRASVILRGDAVPLTTEELAKTNSNRTLTKLSNLAVRAYFDPPRILLGKRNKRGYSHLPLQLGPISNVVLDTTYSDDMLRIGMGGTSGTRFVFARTSDEEAKEYGMLLGLPLVNKVGFMCRLGVLMGLSLYVAGGNGLSSLGERLRAPLLSAMSNAAKHTSGLFANINVRLIRNGVRVLAGMTSCVTGLLMVLISFSSGGIERDEMSRTTLQ